MIDLLSRVNAADRSIEPAPVKQTPRLSGSPRSRRDLLLPGPSGDVSDQTYYRWRREYGGLKVDQARRLKDLQTENNRLKRLLAEAELDKAILKEAASGPQYGCACAGLA